jgi:hypothetical protein
VTYTRIGSIVGHVGHLSVNPFKTSANMLS